MSGESFNLKQPNTAVSLAWVVLANYKRIIISSIHGNHASSFSCGSCLLNSWDEIQQITVERCADTDQLAVGYRDLCILDHHYINVTALG